MAKFLLGFSLLLIAVTAYLGFATKGKVEALQGDLKQTKATLRSTQDTLTTTKATLKKTEEDLAATKATLEMREMDITKLKTDLDDTTKKLADAAKMVEEKAAALELANADMAKLKEKFGEHRPGADDCAKE